MKFFVEFFPLIIFFAVYKFYGLIPATGAIVVATLVATTVSYLKDKKIATMPLISAVVITFFGVLTIALDDERFIKMRPTIVNLVFAAVLFTGLFKRKGLLKYVMGKQITMPDSAWMTLSLRFAMFFLVLAALNEVVWRFFSTDIWVNYKVFGVMGLMVFFLLVQVPFLKRYIDHTDKG